jgi:hypothetical protein
MTSTPLSEPIELHRDRMWHRDEDLRVESAASAERFIEDVGFSPTRFTVLPGRSRIEGLTRSPCFHRLLFTAY